MRSSMQSRLPMRRAWGAETCNAAVLLPKSGGTIRRDWLAGMGAVPKCRRNVAVEPRVSVSVVARACMLVVAMERLSEQKESVTMRNGGIRNELGMEMADPKRVQLYKTAAVLLLYTHHLCSLINLWKYIPAVDTYTHFFPPHTLAMRRKRVVG